MLKVYPDLTLTWVRDATGEGTRNHTLAPPGSCQDCPTHNCLRWFLPPIHACLSTRPHAQRLSVQAQA